MPTVVRHSRELTPVNYKDNLIIVVSDPDIALTEPGVESKRIYLNQLLTVTHDWDPTTDVLDITNLKSHDFLRVINSPSFRLLGNRVIKNDDILLVVGLSPVTLFLIPAKTVRTNDIIMITSADSPYNVNINSDVYIDVSSGPVTVVLPTIHGINDSINLIPNGGRYEVNNLTITATDTMHGSLDPVIVSSDNLLVQARWVDGADGYLFISR